MERPVHLATLLIGLLASGSGMAADDESGAPKRSRAMSPHVAEMLSAAATATGVQSRPASPTEAATATPAGSAPRERLPADPTVPMNGIIRLPDYLVRERKPAKLPEPTDVMVPRELEKYALQTYLGDETGLDRALSMLTPVHLWRRIPVLGRFPMLSFETNEQRAVRMYRADREAKEWGAALELLTPAQRAAIARPTGAAPEKK